MTFAHLGTDLTGADLLFFGIIFVILVGVAMSGKDDR